MTDFSSLIDWTLTSEHVRGFRSRRASSCVWGCVGVRNVGGSGDHGKRRIDGILKLAWHAQHWPVGSAQTVTMRVTWHPLKSVTSTTLPACNPPPPPASFASLRLRRHKDLHAPNSGYTDWGYTRPGLDLVRVCWESTLDRSQLPGLQGNTWEI